MNRGRPDLRKCWICENMDRGIGNLRKNAVIQENLIDFYSLTGDSP